jgi:hypothetical protein
MSIIEAVIRHPASDNSHPALISPRMSVEQALRIFKDTRFGAATRFTAALNKLQTSLACKAFRDYAALYQSISGPLGAMVPQLLPPDLRVLTNHPEAPTQVREIIRQSPDGNLRASNLAQSYTIPLSAILDAYPEIFASNGTWCLRATPEEILKKLAESPHTLLASYALKCLSSPAQKWPRFVGTYPSE